MGNFNINLLDYAFHTQTRDFANNLLSHSLLPCIHHSNRVSENKMSIIDNIFTDTNNTNIACRNILMQIIDHFTQFMMLKNSPFTCSKSELLIYHYSRFNKDVFFEDFTQVVASYLENSD